VRLLDDDDNDDTKPCPCDGVDEVSNNKTITIRIVIGIVIIDSTIDLSEDIHSADDNDDDVTVAALRSVVESEVNVLEGIEGRDVIDIISIIVRPNANASILVALVRCFDPGSCSVL
jgi:hypothetical protein